MRLTEQTASVVESMKAMPVQAPKQVMEVSRQGF